MFNSDIEHEASNIDAYRQNVVFSGLQPLIELIARLLVEEDIRAQSDKPKLEKE